MREWLDTLGQGPRTRAGVSGPAGTAGAEPRAGGHAGHGDGALGARHPAVHGLALPVALFTEAHSRLVAHQDRGGFVPTTLGQLKRRARLSRVWHITLRLTARDTAAWKASGDRLLPNSDRLLSF